MSVSPFSIYLNLRNKQFGGSMWESNPPMRLPTPNTGFEDQRAHQHPSTPIISILLAVC
jgi:hypothetical protein